MSARKIPDKQEVIVAIKVLRYALNDAEEIAVRLSSYREINLIRQFFLKVVEIEEALLHEVVNP